MVREPGCRTVRGSDLIMRAKIAGLNLDIGEPCHKTRWRTASGRPVQANNLKISDEHDTLTPSQVHLESLHYPKEAQHLAELSIEELSHATA